MPTLKIDDLVINNIEQRIQTLAASARPAEASLLKIRMMIALVNGKTISLQDDTGKIQRSFLSHPDIDDWIDKNVSSNLEQYQYARMNLAPFSGRRLSNTNEVSVCTTTKNK